MKKGILFDSHAILKWSQGETGHERVRDLLRLCRNRELSGAMCLLNVGEVYYISVREVGKKKARVFLENLLLLPLKWIQVSEDLIWKASEIKARYPIAFADCFAVASALIEHAEIVTGDPEFSKVESLVKIRWI